MRKTANKYFEGLASDAELRQLLEWLRLRENRSAFKQYKLDWKKSLGHDLFPGGGDEIWNRLQAKLGQNSYQKWQQTLRIQKIYRIAAIFFFILSLGFSVFFLQQNFSATPEIFSTVQTENGQISQIVLPDGSHVWINSGSAVTYSNHFGVSHRNLNLTGEAFFEIAEDRELPLVVDCGQMQVRVTGTRFNVQSYEPESHVEVVLEDGEVELIRAGQKFYTLKQGERVNVDIRKNQFSKAQVNVERYTSWKKGVINIYDLPIEEVAKKLEKRYNQKFELMPDVIGMRYTFTIHNETLEEILKLMEKFTPVIAEQKEDVIIIKADKNKLIEMKR